MDPGTELRFLSSGHRLKLNALLDGSESWKILAGVIKRPGEGREGLVSSQNVRMLEEEKQAGRSPTQVLVDFWSTSGKKSQRPTIATLLKCLRQCELIRVAEFVEKEILRTAPSDPILPPAILSSAILSSATFSSATLSSAITRFSFSDLASWTGDFDSNHVSVGGHKIGEGAFGAVFRTDRVVGDKVLAVKVLKEDLKEQFLNEVNTMTRIQHVNILPLLGVSLDSALCLVMEFMPRGSLLSCLGDKENVLTVQDRVEIALGTARGLNHLHTSFSKPLVHRDVKSDNILLDADLAPKIADFGLARTGSSSIGSTSTAVTTTRHLTQNIIGTSVYMAPEAFRGDVSTKLDTFAFGVVLLELVTGLKPFDDSRDEPDILSHVEEIIDSESGDFEQFISSPKLNKILDPRLTHWPLDVAKHLVVLSRAATEQRKKNRPTMTQVLDTFEKVLMKI